MKELTAKKRWLFSGLIVLAALLIPLLLSISGIFDWSPFDFLIAGILLTGLAISINLAFDHIKKPTTRWLFYIIAILSFVLLWMEMAVGLFGSWLSGS